MRELLEKGLLELGITPTSSMLDKFNQYYKSVLDYNKMVNLTAIKEETDFAIKHFLDSVSSHSWIPDNANVCDVGAGAGFPSIPLKLIRDDISCTMLEAHNKRVTFLNMMIDELGLTMTSAEHSRAEEVARTSLRESFDIVVARAVTSLPTLLEYSIPLLKVGGLLIAYKSNCEEEIAASASALNKLYAEIIAIENFTLPMSDISRSLIIIEKTAKTHKCYPRPAGKPKICPL